MSSGARGKLQQLIEDLREEEGESHAAEPETSSTITFGLSTVTTETSEGHDVVSERTHGAARSAEAGSMRLLKQLQEKVVDLLTERKQLAVLHAQQMQDKDMALTRLQQYIDTQLLELQQRQQSVEEAAPDFQRQLAAARAALQRDLSISAERYQELKQRRPSDLSLSEAVSLVIHEQLKGLRGDNEQLRLAATAARGTSQRLETELAACQRDNARIKAAAADQAREADATITSLQQRCERLAAELQEAAVQVEVLSAKGRLYDELQAKADKLEGEVLRLTASEVALQRLQEEMKEQAVAARDREHRQELLLTDKAYLSRQVEDLESRLRVREEEVEGLRSKVAELKAGRAELYQKLYDSTASRTTEGEGRLEREISRLQVAASADLERIRREVSEASERELRAMRELRDAAQDDASRARGELRALRQAHEELLVRHREEVGRADLQLAELLGEAKLRAFELQRVQALSEERGNSVSALQLQVDTLTSKVRLLTDQLYALDSTSGRRVAELKAQLEAAEAQLAQYQAVQRGGSGGGEAETLATAAAAAAGGDQAPELGPAQQARLQHNLQLAARCARLETERRLLAEQKDTAEAAAAAAQAQLAVANQRLARVGAPQGLLLQQLQDSEERAALAEAQLRQLQLELASKERAAAAAAAERGALKADLEAVLRQRGALDSLRQLMVSALGRSRGAEGEAQA